MHSDILTFEVLHYHDYTTYIFPHLKLWLTKGSCQIKKNPKTKKTRKWVGGSSPNSDLLLSVLLYMFQKIN